MISIPFDRLNINKFWEKTPTPLKYILVFVIFISVSYFVFSKKVETNSVKEIETMKQGIVATYELIDNFEEFRREQNEYNREVYKYLQDLHRLVQELNVSTNKKFDMILKSGNKNTEDIIEKINLVNENFNTIREIYERSLKEAPNLEDNKTKRNYKIEAIPQYPK